MRAVIALGILAVAGAFTSQPRAQAPSDTASYHLFFLGHDIGLETDTFTSSPSGRTLQAAFHFVDRGTAIDLSATLESSPDMSPRHLLVKGRNYRLFTSDSEVTIGGGQAHVRDGKVVSDVPLGKFFFPLDNYAPIGVQDALIKYWSRMGRPAEIAGAPSGPIRIRSRGVAPAATGSRGAARPVAKVLPGGEVEELAIEGVVWGTETAFVDSATMDLLGLTTWAGALPFEAAREGFQGNISTYLKRGAANSAADLTRLTQDVPAAQGAAFALVGATIVDGTARAPIENATVVVRNGRIAAVGPSASTAVPRGVPTLDVKGATIVPGLWDMHAHASQVDWAPVYLASGVTTIRDMGGEPDFLVAFRDAVASGQALGPRVLLAGLVDGPGPTAFGAVTAATPDEGVAVVRKYHDLKFDEMKIYGLVKPDVVAAIIGEAHRLGMTVTGHVPQGMTSQSVVEAGFDGIAHMQLRGQSGSDASKQQIAFFKTHRTVMDPTESWNELGGHAAATPLESFLPGVSRLPRPLARMFASMPGSAGDPAAIHARLIDGIKLLKDAIDAGLLVVAGTDKGVPGFSLQREIELYVEGGMTPLEAIQAASIMPARAMRLDKDTGTVEVGKRADMVVLTGNPLANIANIRSAKWVVANGRVFECNALWKAAGYAPRQ